jgi:hypothetical protein
MQVLPFPFVSLFLLSAAILRRGSRSFADLGAPFSRRVTPIHRANIAPQAQGPIAAWSGPCPSGWPSRVGSRMSQLQPPPAPGVIHLYDHGWDGFKNDHQIQPQ